MRNCWLKRCHTPLKDAYRYPREAERAAAAASVQYGHAMEAYLCECGWHHITKVKPMPSTPVGKRFTR